MSEYEEDDPIKMFTSGEIKLLANKYYFWKGLFIGAIGMLITILALGLFINY